MPGEQWTQHQWISIHALRKESDVMVPILIIHLLKFQSTLSVRRATPPKLRDGEIVSISIHALRKESDLEPQE